MNLPPETVTELELLVSRLIDAKLEPQEQQELNQILAVDAEARRIYFDRIAVHAMLIWEESAATKRTPELAPPSRWRQLFRPRWMGAAAALLMLSGLTYLALETRHTVVTTPELPTFASIGLARECLWAGGTMPTVAGARLGCGTLQLVKGEALIRFDSGAQLAMTGPATLELQTAMLASLRSGTIVVEVPEHAMGFAIQSGATKFVDLGTKFGVIATESGSSELHTFAGKVEIQGSGRSAHVVSAGQAQSFDSEGNSSAIGRIDAQRFERVLAFVDNSTPAKSREYARRVLADQPMGYWQFEEQHLTASGDVSDSSDLHNPGTLHGGIKSVAGVPGTGGQALEFDGSTGFVSVAHKPHYSSPELSVELWFKTTEAWTERTWPGSAVLVSKDVPGDGNHDWYIIGGASISGHNEGRVIVGVGVPPHDQQLLSQPSLNDGQWHHIVWTRDRSGLNILYVDGVESQRLQDRGGPINNPMDIEIGGGTRSVSKTPPGTKTPLGLDGKPLGDLLFLQGALDEVAIYGHVLSSEQVAAHFHAGMAKP